LDIKKPETKGQDSRFYKFSVHNKKHIQKSSFLRHAISKKEKYERKVKDIDVKENSPENLNVERTENVEMADNAPIDYETQIRDFDRELDEQQEI
jgi:hypothetical protein